jgi:hypothetical protein
MPQPPGPDIPPISPSVPPGMPPPVA